MRSTVESWVCLCAAPLSRGFERSRAELSRLDAADEQDDGTGALVRELRERVCTMDEQCERADREKAVLADLLNAKKRDFEQVSQTDRERQSEGQSKLNTLTERKTALEC